MRKALSGILLGILSLMFIVTTAGSSNAAIPNLRITEIGYNARGADVEGNRNKEYVDIKNVASTAVSIPVNGLKIQDQWARKTTNNVKNCNTYMVNENLVLDQNETLRVYVGYGVPNFSGTTHFRYMNSSQDCGYNGHFINNLGDTLWVTLGENVMAKSFNFENGYTVN